MSGGLLRRKTEGLAEHAGAEGGGLRRTLGWPQLLALGVGAIVGTGIYTLTGVAAGLAGPGVILSFLAAGAVCACAALAYAEMATTIPAAGSAYTYSYVVLGEIVAWVVGWSLILEYTVVGSTVAVGWSAHFAEFLRAAGWPAPAALMAGPFDGGLVNLPAVVIALLVAALLAAGTKESARVTVVLVILKLVALAVFVALTAPAFMAANFHPFLPEGLGAVRHPGDPSGAKYGVMGAAALIFFAFYGFDAVSTAAEEVKDPKRDLTIGIIGSMAACTAIYMIVAACAIGASPVAAFAGNGAPLVYILRSLRHPLAATVVAGAAVVALPTVILAFMYGQSRIFYVMARDGLLPRALAKVSARTGTPVTMTLVTGVIVAVLGGLLPLQAIAELANAGTLCAFIAVSLCMLVLRRREPDRVRLFRAPAAWVIGPFAIVGCLYLFSSLPVFTMVWFLGWNAVGVVVYALFARRNAVAAG